MSPSVKIVFELKPDEDGFPPVGSESINGSPERDGSFILDNTPFFVTDVALGDRVAAHEIAGTEGQFAFSHVIEPSQVKSISIIFLVDELKEQIFQYLRGQGCYCEYGDFGALEMLAVSIPDTCDYGPLRSYLMDHEQNNILSFAELAV
ncbi:DUF4265 domain-containing protein [Enhygromyxa salina]|uniref:DUF4265 domain-containing protein n=1 Tax=Enhygromyxa salina TaxID=215803 RepID=A0A2S9YXU2_9BACT|nr:DUF4265 domain-containing protein [Enhygromyxa salina]PRQ09901.1 hypothetical protein ENSA7_03820 [Enhygromyxa salina]